jgi:maltose alpha-D-glucosyltransferase/alpha-amylase
MKPRKSLASPALLADPLWYKDAIIYELHARAFSDSNADGIGDLRGLCEKLDYLQDLGVTAVWLLPFYPSPLRDDGYDIADYTDVNPIYGNLSDFKAFLRGAHLRGMRVITELVINHTSDQHPWFQRARRAPPGSAWRDFYVWSDTPDKFQEARIIFQDFEASNWTWDPVAKAYYWHRFYSHQPDLNFDNPAVHEAVLGALEFWLDLGIDGLRLDAIPYLYERDGTNCENLPQTHEFLKKLRRHVDDHFKDRMLLAEANQWPEDAVAYFGEGDECHMAFHFPLMPRLFMAIRMEDRFPIIDILQQTPAIPESSQWALFLRNHDELTLEMVTAEDRDYMYRVYAQDAHARVNLGIRRRLAPLLENHRGKIELMNGILFSLPGTPVIYYGDEIGMGDNIYLGDRNGVRTPMQWTPERNAGFSRGNPQRLYLPAIIDPEYQYQTVNVEAQQNNPHSLLWWMKRLIALRKRHHAFGRGSLEFLYPENHKVLVFLRRFEAEQILVVANLSRFVQGVQIDLSAFKGMIPVEMLGRVALPAIGEQPYLLTLSPYAFYWLSLEPKSADQPLLAAAAPTLPTLEVTGNWQAVFGSRVRDELEAVLLGYLRGQRWFAGRGGHPTTARIAEQVPIASGKSETFFTLLQVEYVDEEPKTFVLPVTFHPVTSEEKLKNHASAICRLRFRRDPDSAFEQGVLVDPLGEKDFSLSLLDAFARHRRFRGKGGIVGGWTAPDYHRLRGLADAPGELAVTKREQGNTLVTFGDRFTLKVYRCVEEGIHPEFEIGRALGEKTSFNHAVPLAGILQYRTGQGAPTTLGVLQPYVAHEGTAWGYTLDALRRYFEHILTQPPAALQPVPNRPLLELIEQGLPPEATELISTYLEAVRLMGQRTAELHLTLAAITDDAAFTPEPFSILMQRSMYQTARTWVFRVFQLLREHMQLLPQEARADAQIVLARTSDLLLHLRAIMSQRIDGQRIRCHGDCHLDSLLYTGKDFVFTDFEGELLRPLSNRRHKSTPLSDVASLLHSLAFAVRTALHHDHLRPEDRPVLEPWGRTWLLWVSAVLVKSYLEHVSGAAFLPRAHVEQQMLLDFYLLGRGIYELRYQLLNHPEQVQIPLQALLHQLESRERRLAANLQAPG